MPPIGAPVAKEEEGQRRVAAKKGAVPVAQEAKSDTAPLRRRGGTVSPHREEPPRGVPS